MKKKHSLQRGGGGDVVVPRFCALAKKKTTVTCYTEIKVFHANLETVKRFLIVIQTFFVFQAYS